MLYHYITIVGITCVITYLFHKTLANPVTLFTLVWTIVMVLSSLQLFNLYSVSIETYRIIYYGVSAFVVGFYIYYIFLERILVHFKGKMMIKTYIVNKKATSCIFYMITAFGLFKLVKVIGLFLSGANMNLIRSNFSSVVLGNKWLLIYDSYVNRPLVFAFLAVAAVAFFLEKDNNKIMGMAVIVVGLNAFTDGGRVLFIYLLIHFIILRILIKKKINISKKAKRRLRFLLIGVAIGFFLISSLRVISMTLVEQLYIYISGCVPHLEYRINAADMVGAQTNGWTVLNGYYKPLLQLFSFVFGYPQGYMDALILGDVSNFVNIGYGVTFNAFVSLFYYFYLDGGTLGVVVFSALYGVVCAISYCRIRHRTNILNFSIYLLIIQGLLFSLVRWQFYNSEYALSFLYVLLFVQKRTMGERVYRRS